MTTFFRNGVTAFLLAAPLLTSELAAQTKFGLNLISDGFVSPTALSSLPEGGMIVSDQPGTVHYIGKDGARASQLFLDLRPKMAKLNPGFDERGLLGLALHPKFTENRKFYVAYSAPLRDGAPKDWNHTMRISRFLANDTGKSADSNSEHVLLEIDQPYFNHNGGALAFGPDGFLYISIGDGGNANDVDESNKSLGRPPEGNGQNLETLLGKILRIDVNTDSGYNVPKDNPFVGKKARPEIWAFGLRNTWRMSFDRGGQRQLIGGEVGQNLWEEVNVIQKGGNYGWRIREAYVCFDPKSARKSPDDCPKVGANGEPLLDPVLAYKNFSGYPRDPESRGVSITGGYVYRGKAIPEWQGKYIFGDWSSSFVKPGGVLFAATMSGDRWTFESIKPETHPNGLNMFVVSFGEDSDGELYVMTNDSNGLSTSTGKLFKIVPH